MVGRPRTGMLIPLLAVAMFPAGGAAAAEDLGPVVEEGVLVVGDRLVTRSDLELEARVVLVRRGGLDAAFAPLDADTTAAVLDWLATELLVLEQAERLEVFAVPRDEVASAVEAFVDRFPSEGAYEAFLSALDVSPERIAAIFRRSLRVERYLDGRVRLSVRVTDADVVEHHERLRDAGDDRSLEEAGPSIRARLERRRYDEAVARLVGDLRRGGEVRTLSEPPAFAALPAPEATPEPPEPPEPVPVPDGDRVDARRRHDGPRAEGNRSGKVDVTALEDLSVGAP